MKSLPSPTAIFIVFIIVAGIIWMSFTNRVHNQNNAGQTGSVNAVPVEVGKIKRGPIERRRTFSGSLEPAAEFIIAPKVSGRVERIFVDLGDVVEKGQVVAELENDEFLQAVALAKADLQVAVANLEEAKNALEISTRELKRFETLRIRGVASDSQLDTTRADQLSRQAAREVAQAQLGRAEALLETARIRLGYTRITASWADTDSSRVVSERFVDEGETVAANASLLSIISLDPIKGIIYVTEKDYGGLRAGQPAFLETDAFPDTRFKARIDRISPVFDRNSRQANVELEIDNDQRVLKPGMFIRVTIVLDRMNDASIVPEQALTSRDDKTGIFLVNKKNRTVHWLPVRVGIRDSGNVAIDGPFLSDLSFPQDVVILGQQLLSDGSYIIVPEPSKSVHAGQQEASEQ